MIPQHKPHTENQGSSRIGMGFTEFVITIAIMTASIAMAIDSMLPALPAIGRSLERDEHQRCATHHRCLLPRLRCLADHLRQPLRHLRPPPHPARRPRRLRAGDVRRGTDRQLRDAARHALRPGYWRCRGAHHHDGGCPRLLRRPRNGPRHVLRDDRLHDRADRRAFRRPA